MYLMPLSLQDNQLILILIFFKCVLHKMERAVGNEEQFFLMCYKKVEISPDIWIALQVLGNIFGHDLVHYGMCTLHSSLEKAKPIKICLQHFL